MASATKKTTSSTKSTDDLLNERLALVGRVEGGIYLIRGQRVMLSYDLAEIYGVELRALTQAVKRNPDRFPLDFAYLLTNQEFAILKSQSVISSSGWGGARTAPIAFTEMGVAMLSSVLRSERAVSANIEIMRAFVALRHWVLSYDQLQRRLEEMEGRYDGHFKIVFKALRQIIRDEAKPKVKIGFN